MLTKENKIKEFKDNRHNENDIKRLMAAIVVNGRLTHSKGFTPSIENLEDVSDWVENLYNLW